MNEQPNADRPSAADSPENLPAQSVDQSAVDQSAVEQSAVDQTAVDQAALDQAAQPEESQVWMPPAAGYGSALPPYGYSPVGYQQYESPMRSEHPFYAESGPVNVTAAYPQAGYQQGGYEQGQYQQGQYPQGQYPQGGYQQGHYQPTAYPQSQYNQGQYTQSNYGPGQYAQNEYPQNQYAQSGYPQGPYARPPYSPYGAQGYWAPPAPRPAPRRRRVLIGSVAVATAAVLGVSGIAYSVERSNHAGSQQTSVTSPGTQTNPFSGNGSSGGSSGSGSSGGGQFGWSNPFGSGGSSGGSGSGSSGSAATATAAQEKGVVDIVTELDYGSGKAAGTGIVLSSDGTILTNNHVVQGSTSISVTVVSTGKTYTGRVVGTDPTDDVAVVKLQNAAGLTTANLGDSTKLAVGNSVTAVGNAGGTGGTPSAATGTVTALGQSITASDSDGSNAESLTGMIQIDADIQAGDSGGPLYNSSGQVVGIDTAASTSRLSQTVGFAIPIAKATSLAQQILSGTDNATIHQGYPAFLGVQLSASASAAVDGVPVAGVVPGSAAAKAGLVAGDTIAAVGGKATANATALSTVMKSYNPGDRVSIKWLDSNAASHSATVTLGSGPAD